MKVYKEEIEILKLNGKDVIDFLQRVSTNDFKNFYVNSILRTVLTTEKGRIVDFITVLHYHSKFVIITSAGRERIVSDFLYKYIVTEDIEIDFDKLNKHTFIPEFDHDYEFLSGCNKVEENYLYFDDYAFKKLILLSKNEDSDFKKALLENCEFIHYNEFKEISINKGFLFESNELNDEINPLECGLREYISFTKGCYIGQEVISRLDAQGKIPKLMVKIISDFEMNSGDKIYFQDSGLETECGFLTSTGKRDNSFIALGFIKGINFNVNYKYYINKNLNNTILINK